MSDWVRRVIEIEEGKREKTFDTRIWIDFLTHGRGQTLTLKRLIEDKFSSRRKSTKF